MKKIISGILLLFALATWEFANPAFAGDTDAGAALFTANCAACHMGGRNAVNPAKTLQKSDLEKYEMYDLEKIKYQVTNGKMAMPAFANRLTEEEIDTVASYVLTQADEGW